VQALQEAEDDAAAAYEEREYNPFAPSLIKKDPWDDEPIPKDAWVGPVIRAIERNLTPPEVRSQALPT
jgi:hypothetical protein